MGANELTLREFGTQLASGAPTPGGGGAAALCGALAAALCSMVANLTVGKKKYADVEEQVKEQCARAEVLRTRLLDLIDGDAAAFAPLAAAYSLPSETEEQKQQKAKVMGHALEVACGAPLEIMQRCGEAVEIADFMAKSGSVMAVSDAAAAAALAAGALQAASLNIYINTKTMADRQMAEAFNAKADAFLERYESLAQQVFDGVMARLRPQEG